jgi:hypothetical protein
LHAFRLSDEVCEHLEKLKGKTKLTKTDLVEKGLLLLSPKSLAA